MFANNPSMLAYAYAKSQGYKDEQIFIISLGTGINKNQTNFFGGAFNSVMGVLDITMEGEIISTTLHNILPHGNYYRIQIDLDKNFSLDDYNKVPSLKSKALAYLNDPKNKNFLTEVELKIISLSNLKEHITKNQIVDN